jgi:hypothetical protein
MAEARILYIATDDGLIQLANPGRSDRWREVGRALEGQPVRVVAAAPNDPLTIVAATVEAVHRTMDGGFSWELIWQGEATALAFSDDGALYIGTKDGVLLRQHGEAWDEELRADGAVTGIVVGDELFAVSDPHAVWKLSGTEREDLVGGLNSSTYVVGMAAYSSKPSQVTVLCEQTDAGPLTAPQFLTGGVVVLGGPEPVLLVGTQGGLLRATQQVMDWIGVVSLSPTYHEGFNPVPGPQNVSALVTPPRFIDQVFATTKSGELWFSNDRGRTWTALRTDLPPAHDLGFARAR